SSSARPPGPTRRRARIRRPADPGASAGRTAASPTSIRPSSSHPQTTSDPFPHTHSTKGHAMKRSIMAGAAAAGAALVLAGCSGGAGGASGGDPDTLTISGWSVSSTPEFQLLADGFEAQHEGISVEIVDYDPTEDNTRVTADLAAGSAPDIITQKEVKFVTTCQEGGQLLDVSDVEVPDDIGGAASYEIDGTTYATPYRQDSWVLYYNKALFDEAGVDYPDGSWNWD